MFVISFFFFWLLFFQVIKNVAKFKIEVRDFYDMANSQHFVWDSQRCDPSFSEPEQIASDWWVHTTFHISPDI